MTEQEQLALDAARWRFVRSRGTVTVNEDGVPMLVVILDESEIPDVLHALVMERGGAQKPDDLDAVVDTARSGREGA